MGVRITNPVPREKPIGPVAFAIPDVPLHVDVLRPRSSVADRHVRSVGVVVP